MDLRVGRPDEPWVCLSCERRQWSLGITKWARELFKAAGVGNEHGTLHRLRHTFCTNLLLGGADLETVRDLAGHQDISTTGRYLSTTSRRKAEAVASLPGSH